MKRKNALVIIVLLLSLNAVDHAQNMNSKAGSTIKIKHLIQDFAVSDLSNDAWENGTEVLIKNYWSGQKAPEGRWVKARLLWSSTGIYVRFEANQNEPLIVSDKPDIIKKVVGLWDRDVCEIFIAPNASLRNKYFEFEIAPTGEWIDLGIEIASQKRKTDLDYKSAMTSAARIENGKVVMAIKIPWEAFGARPKMNDVWLGNLFRCVGKDPTRGYLAWRPTKTAKPNFHVPKAFGEFEFVK